MNNDSSKFEDALNCASVNTTSFFDDPTRIRVRPITCSDFDTINNWQKQFYESISNSVYFTCSRTRQAENTVLDSCNLCCKRDLYLIALIDSVPAGYIAFDPVTVSTSRKVTEIFVDPKYRRQGVAKHLLSEGQKILRKHGAASTRVKIYTDNDAALRFYLVDNYCINTTYYISDPEHIEHADCKYTATEVTREYARKFCDEQHIYCKYAIGWFFCAEDKALLEVGGCVNGLCCVLHGDKEYYPALINALADLHLAEDIHTIYLDEIGAPTIKQGFVPFQILLSKKLN